VPCRPNYGCGQKQEYCGSGSPIPSRARRTLAEQLGRTVHLRCGSGGCCQRLSRSGREQFPNSRQAAGFNLRLGREFVRPTFSLIGCLSDLRQTPQKASSARRRMHRGGRQTPPESPQLHHVPARASPQSIGCPDSCKPLGPPGSSVWVVVATEGP